MILRVDRKELESLICKAYCAYYKSQKDEGLFCLSFMVIERLFEKGGNRSSGKSDKLSGSGTESILSEDLCINCLYHANDCDFAAGVEGASPCGGFIFLGNLIAESLLSRRELQKAVREVLAGEK
jgi:hypothetical protein